MIGTNLFNTHTYTVCEMIDVYFLDFPSGWRYKYPLYIPVNTRIVNRVPVTQVSPWRE